MQVLNIDKSINIFGEPLETCSESPVTGFFRDGCCNTNAQDTGSHTICIEVTEEFLEYSNLQGNDLTTPNLGYGFPGLKPGNCWCLCAARWLDAHKIGMAPKVYLAKTHIKALEIVPFELMQEYAVDLN